MKSIFRVIAIAALTASLPIRSGRAQPALSTLGPGDTIRVWAVGPRLNGNRGTFLSLADDTLRMGYMPTTTGGPAFIAVPYQSLRRIDVNRGRERSVGRTLTFTAVGAVTGMLVGLAVGPIAECGGDCGGEGEGIAGAILGMGSGLLIGGVGGGVIGARKRTHWVSVSLTR